MPPWKTISFIITLHLFAGDLGYKHIVMEEICDNAIDDDNDGLIDINDPDCMCEMVSLESIIPNPSFENQNCCPSDHSQMDCAEAWIQPSLGTSDYIHQCGYKYGLIENTSLEVFPDGNGAVGVLAGRDPDGDVHIEYVGACVNNPMLAGSTYRLKLHVGFLSDFYSSSFNLAIYGAPSCNNLPFSIFGTSCPLAYPDWYPLAEDEVDSEGVINVWREFTFNIQPGFDVNAIVIGAGCQHGSADEQLGFLLDNLILVDENNLDFELVDQKHPCDPEFVFGVVENSNFSYQWYNAGIALIGETFPELSQMYGEGDYQLRIINELTEQCRIADEFDFRIPKFSTEIFETICEGGEFLFRGDIIDEAGTYEYNLTASNGCDSILTLNVEMVIPIPDTLNAQILPGQSFTLGGIQYTDEGRYFLNLSTSGNCDSSLVLNLEHLKVFIPNVFSPNGDNINDFFEVSTSNDEYVSIDISIFDRWGSLIYRGEKWDGRHENKRVATGVYMYLIKLVDNQGKELMLSNSVTVVR